MFFWVTLQQRHLRIRNLKNINSITHCYPYYRNFYFYFCLFQIRPMRIVASPGSPNLVAGALSVCLISPPSIWYHSFPSCPHLSRARIESLNSLLAPQWRRRPDQRPHGRPVQLHLNTTKVRKPEGYSAGCPPFCVVNDSLHLKPPFRTEGLMQDRAPRR